MIVGFFKLLTAPFWVPFWVIGAIFRARSVARTGRKVYPVTVRALPAPTPRSVVYVLSQPIPRRPDLP